MCDNTTKKNTLKIYCKLKIRNKYSQFICQNSQLHQNKKENSEFDIISFTHRTGHLYNVSGNSRPKRQNYRSRQTPHNYLKNYGANN
jgi:hypothetical protein